MSNKRGYSREGSRQNEYHESRGSSQNSNWTHNTNQENNGWGNNTETRDKRQVEEHRKLDRQSHHGNSKMIRVSYDAIDCLTANNNRKLTELENETGARIKVAYNGTYKMFYMLYVFVIIGGS